MTTPHFELYTTSGEKKGRDAVQYFEQVRDLFVRISSARRNDSARVRIVAFSNPKEYKPFSPGESFTAFYVYVGEREYIVMSGIRDENYPTAVHEYTHLWLKQGDAKIPVWLNEGLAEVHSTLKQVGGKVQLGHPIIDRLRLLQESKWIPLSQLLTIEKLAGGHNDKDTTSVFYSESWLLTHMLYLGEQYRPGFARFLQVLIESGGDGARAFEQAYGKPVAEVEKDLRSYSRSDRMNYRWFDARMDKPSEAPVVSEVTPFESAMVLGDLYGAVGKPAEAEKILERLAKDNPEQWEVEEARGLAAWRNRDLEGARDHYARAFDLKSTNAAMCLEYAKMLQGSAPDRSIAVLRRALELDPGQREAHIMLGNVLYGKREFAAAAAQFVAVREIKADEAFPILTMLAHSQYESGNKDSAKLNAAKARKFARTPEEVGSAEQLIRYVEQRPREVSTVALREAVSEPAASRPPGTPSPDNAVRHEREPLRAEGTLRQLDCLSGGARLHVIVGGRRMTFLIRNPRAISVRGAAPDGSVNFTCGPQNAKKVAVEYFADASVEPGIAGVVHSLEFLTP